MVFPSPRRFILLDAAKHERYPKGGHKSTIGIRNAILETKVKSLLVFNSSKEVVQQPNFAKNKES